MTANTQSDTSANAISGGTEELLLAVSEDIADLEDRLGKLRGVRQGLAIELLADGMSEREVGSLAGWFATDGTAFAHGWVQMWCVICVLEEQIKHAKERARKLPAMERKLARLKAREIRRAKR